jgi:hypothetical protein
MPATASDRLRGLTTSIAVKGPVSAITTANITLSGLAQSTLSLGSGVTLAEGTRVLVKDQSDTTQNGIYLASSSDWQRSEDFDGARDVVNGTLVVFPISIGNGAFYQVSCASNPIIGTSAITFSLLDNPNVTYPRTQTEIVNGFVPTNDTYVEGNVARGGAVGDGVTNDAAAIQAVYDALPTDGLLTFPHGKTYYLGTGAAPLVFDDQKNIDFNGAKFTWGGSSGIVMQIGGGAGFQRYVSIRGPFQIQRTATISHNGTQSAASQLLATGLKLLNLADSSVIEGHRGFISGFKYGIYVEANDGGCTNSRVSDISTQDCLLGLYQACVDAGAPGATFITNMLYTGIHDTFNTAFYSSIAGTRSYESLQNNRTIDGNTFVRFDMGAHKERKFKEDGKSSRWLDSYLDTSNGVTDIELTANSQSIIIDGGADLRLMGIVDNGILNSYPDVYRKQTRLVNGISTEFYSFNGGADLSAGVLTIGTTLTDDGSFDLPASSSGIIQVDCGAEGGVWKVKTDGTTVKLSGTTNTAADGSDTKLSVFQASANQPRVINRLGASNKTTFRYVYST